MANYRVFHTPLFDEQFDALVLVDQRRVDKIEEQLAEKGSLAGKPSVSFFSAKRN